MIINKNEITKGEFDELNEIYDFDKFTPEQVAITMLSINALIKKGETEDLSTEEQDLIKSGTLELKNLTKYTINELIQGQIIKSDIYTQPKQVKWLDVIEKSETGEKIEKGIFLNTPLNKQLNRVGITFEKGKAVPSKSSIEEAAKEKEEMEKAKKTMDGSEMYKAATALIRKGDMTKQEIYKKMMGKYPGMDKDTAKDYMNKAYKAVGNDYMAKAEVEIEIGDDEEKDEKDENGNGNGNGNNVDKAKKK